MIVLTNVISVSVGGCQDQQKCSVSEVARMNAVNYVEPEARTVIVVLVSQEDPLVLNILERI